MNWLEADNGFLVNLDKVKAVQRASEYSCTIFFNIGDVIESVTVSMPYESLRGLLKFKQDEASKNLRTIAQGQFTPVP